MSKRIKDFDEASEVLSDDYILMDSPTGGTRKYLTRSFFAAAAAAASPVLDDWSEAAMYINAGLGQVYFPVGSAFAEDWSTWASEGASEAAYAPRFDVMHHMRGLLGTGEEIPVMVAQMHHCLPFETQFSPYQAFLAVAGSTPLPAGTYHVTMGFSWGTHVVSGKSYQFTLASALPVGGQLCGFYGAPDQAPSNWKVYAYESATATTATETVSVTEGTGGTSLGTFTAAGVLVPASGTPATSVVTVGSTAVTVYGLNSLHRVAYGNNRWLHSPLRQFLNKSGFNWWSPATVFDRPPAYASRKGFLSGFSEDFLAHIRPIKRETALSYVTDGGTSGAPEYDVTYDRFVLPSGREHFLADNSTFGGGAGREGDEWTGWKNIANVSTAKAWYGTYPEFIQYDLASPTTPRHGWMRSAYRSDGLSVAVVTSSGGCGSNFAVGGCRAAPACAIG